MYVAFCLAFSVGPPLESHHTSVVADMPKAKTICELGFNLGHGASTILASLDRPERFYAFDLGEDVVEKVRDRAAARTIASTTDLVIFSLQMNAGSGRT